MTTNLFHIISPETGEVLGPFTTHAAAAAKLASSADWISPNAYVFQGSESEAVAFAIVRTDLAQPYPDACTWSDAEIRSAARDALAAGGNPDDPTYDAYVAVAQQ